MNAVVQVHAFGINQGPLKLSSWSLIPDWFWATDPTSGTPMHRTRAVYYEGPPLPLQHNGVDSTMYSVAADLELVRQARQLRARLRRAQLRATTVKSAIHSADEFQKPDTTAPLCCDGQPTCNNAGTGANAPALYRFELPP
eukprot:SAG11_NODE_15554_length_574_cov_0.797895_1_plen_140_part_10